MRHIANPIYDVVFKYLMQDNAAAKLLLSAILDQPIELLEVLPQEYTVRSGARPELAVIRFDYRAIIREPNGSTKKVLIELQKIHQLLDIGRFRHYLGTNYSTPNQVEGVDQHLPIITIYLLGFGLEVKSPVIRVGGTYIDAVTKTAIEGTDAFIEALTHQAYFIQIPLLPDKQKTRVERVLSVFSQKWVVDKKNRFSMQYPDDLTNEDNLLLINRLGEVLADTEMQNQAFEEESFDRVLAREFNQQFHKGETVGLEKGEAIGLEKGKLEGLEEGVKKGKLEGKLEKSRATLRSLLQKKFKVVLSDEINQKIETAELDILDRWIENIFDAESIEGLLK